MLAFLTEKLKNQHIDDPVNPLVCDINLIQGKKISLKSKSKISEWRSRKISSHSKAAKSSSSSKCDVEPLITTQQSDPSSLADTSTLSAPPHPDTSLTPHPPKKKQCLLSHHSDWLPWAEHVVPTARTHTSQLHTTFPHLISVSSARNFNFSTPNIGLHSSDHATESPAPRPASVSSGFCERTISPVPRSLGDVTPTGVPWSFHFRSLSLEERLPTPTVTRRLSCAAASPSRHHIPRCHSQPCVMYDRKCGIKRRRDHDRPTLDFNKMTETAYGSSEKRMNVGRTRHKSACSWSSRFKEELLPIASSPLDHDVPLHSFISPSASPIKATSSDAIITGIGWDVCTDSGCSDMDDRDLVSLSAADQDCQDNSDNDDDRNSMFAITDLDVDEIERH